MGVMAALYYEKIVGTVRRFYPLVTCFFITLFGITYYLSHHADLQNGRNLVDTASSVFFVAAILCLMQKLRIGSKPLSFIGGISFEIYLLHMLVYKLYFHFVHLKASITLVFYLLIVGLTAYLLNKLFRHVNFSRLGYRGRSASMDAPQGLSRQH
jgi:membrane-bound acyltransferase YfiQ involved in biofilm formation